MRLQLNIFWFIIQNVRMRTYIFALVLSAETGKDEAKSKKLVESLVADAGGKVVKSVVLGVRDLAYKIKGKTNGWFGFFTVELPAEKAKSLGKQANLNEQILRYLLLAHEAKKEK